MCAPLQMQLFSVSLLASVLQTSPDPKTSRAEQDPVLRARPSSLLAPFCTRHPGIGAALRRHSPICPNLRRRKGRLVPMKYARWCQDLSFRLQTAPTPEPSLQGSKGPDVRGGEPPRPRDHRRLLRGQRETWFEAWACRAPLGARLRTGGRTATRTSAK